MKNRILLIGEIPGEESYHPAAPVLPLVEQKLCKTHCCNIAYGINWINDLPRYTVIVNYLDRFSPCSLSDNQAAAIMQWVEQGGGMILFHSGVCIAKHPAVFPWLGYSFSHHPAQEVLHFHPTERHPITKGISSFSFQDEPYHYIFCKDLSDFHVVMEYSFAGESAPLPAVWYRRYGKGTVVNLCMGHTASQAGDPHTLELVCNTVDWLCSNQESCAIP